MYYIVGLGNKGSEYENTRHNVGFFVVERAIEKGGLPSLHKSSTYNGQVSVGVLGGKEVSVLLPETFMNVSGSAVAKFVPKNDAAKFCVVYDDIDLPLGELKVSFGRGDGGHNGIKSIIQMLGTKDFARVRIGIGKKSIWTGELVRPKGNALAAYVLGKFSAKEQKMLDGVAERTYQALRTFLEKGIEQTMNTYN